MEQLMRAYAYCDAVSVENLRLVERPDPTPGPNDIVLRMLAATLNYRDVAIMRGNYHIGVSPPLVPVSDGAGEVVSVGPAVTRFAVGELACPTYLPAWLDGPIQPHHARRRLGGPNDGVLSEFMCLHEDEAVLAPAHLEAVEAAALPVLGVTAWHCLFHTGRLRPGDAVVVQGSGGVSIMALQLARTAGARPIVVVRNDHHVERLRALGASEVLTNGGDDEWVDRVIDLTKGIGADVAINVAGGSTLSNSIAATRVGGHVHQIGYAAATSAEFDIFTAIRRAATIQLATAGSRQDFEELNRTIEQHAVRPVIAETFPVGRLADALGVVAKGGAFGKIALKLAF
jgi:NADPH:quinone reductase-like Zn-dependent oxidoreductase